MQSKKELLNKIKELEEELKKRTIELTIAKEKAEESDRLKTSFLANLSHEIRTPINGIIGFSSLLAHKDISIDKKENYTELIQNNCTHLLSLVNNIIDISKIEVRQIAIHEEIIDLHEILENVFNNFNNVKYTKNKIKFILKKENQNKVFKIKADSLKIKQVLFNLVSNAFKFTEEGRIEFGYTFKNDTNLLFYVKDTGIGIPKDGQKIIFERFRQIESEKDYGGTGLGLTISKSFVELMGGKIEVNSNKNGSDFHFTIPYDNHENENNWNNKNLIIVESENSNFVYIKELLSETEIQILWVENTNDAIELIKKLDIVNIVLLNYTELKTDNFYFLKKYEEAGYDFPIMVYATRNKGFMEIEKINPKLIIKNIFNKKELLLKMKKNIL